MLYVNLFLYTFSNFLIGLIWPMCLTKRIEKTSNVIYAIIYYVILLMPSCVKFFSVPYTLLFEFMYYSGMVGIVLFLIFAFKDAIWKKLLFFVFMMIVMIMGESVSSAILALLGVTISVDFSFWETTLLMISVISMDMLVMLLLAFFWNKIVRHSDGGGTDFWLILSIPLSNLMLVSAIASIDKNGVSPLNLFNSIVLALGISLEVTISFLIHFYSERKKNEEEIACLRASMQMDKEYYAELENRIDALSKQRHDRNNKLAVVKGLLDSEDSEALIAFLKSCSR